ncbi:uncharacterized protein LOC112344292 [Selaginella moellendorffii]|uniref:uncharacterized protein LOC112344292 n=1 Tax=Selaginella moellendorffii TaxID=88036 RepID=UPI000D1C4861|nr:uncharacterized protein LOC112344292 [Selaginella moellendorffii]|eukprot:XP_024524495.1 uncharacterized protein LOC112344292 [Selaginella moellendorffii]
MDRISWAFQCPLESLRVRNRTARTTLLLLLCGCSFFFRSSSQSDDVRTLDVGRERLGEILPLAAMGSAVYQVRGLDPAHDYEIKVSYPASVPAAFSLTLLHSRRSSGTTRRLLNVEKIIFPAREHLILDEGSHKVFVRVSVKPAGVIAKRNFKEQEFIVYNIMCERVFFSGIPEQAWWIGFLATGALLFSYFLANILPHLLFGTTAKSAQN